MLHKELYRTTPLLMWLAIGIVAGCAPAAPGTRGSAASPATTPGSRPISLITPIDFFTPDQRRLSQHLGWQTGCFQVKYSGPETPIRCRVEVWREGKNDTDGSNLSSIGAGDNEISISVRDEAEVAGKPRSYRVTKVLTAGTGSSGGSMILTKPELGGWSTSVTQIYSPVELIPGQEIAVWALMHIKTNRRKERDSPSSKASIAEQAKEADWAIVLKVGLGPVPEKGP